MKKISLFTIYLTLFLNLSCKKNSEINNFSNYSINGDSITDFTEDHFPVTSEQINNVLFSDMINNSERIYFTRVLVWKDNFDDIFYHPDLPIIMEGKFDNDRHVFIEIDRRNLEDKFLYNEDKLIIENKNYNNGIDKYIYEVEFRDNYIFLIDKSIKPTGTGLIKGVRAGLIIYKSDPYQNREVYEKILENDF